MPHQLSPLTIILSISHHQMLFLMLCCKLLHKLADMILHKDTTCIYIIQTSLFDISYSCNSWMFAKNHLLRFNHVLVSPFWAYLINRFFIQRLSLIQMLVYHTMYTCWAVNGCLFTTDFDLVSRPLCWGVQRAPETLEAGLDDKLSSPADLWWEPVRGQ